MLKVLQRLVELSEMGIEYRFVRVPPSNALKCEMRDSFQGTRQDISWEFAYLVTSQFPEVVIEDDLQRAKLNFQTERRNENH